MLCLLGVRALQLEYGRTTIPENSAEEQDLCRTIVEKGEGPRIGVSLRCPLGGPIAVCSGVRDHRKIDGRDRAAEGGIGHMAESAGLIPEGRHVFVEIQQPAKYSHCVISGALKYRRVTFPLGIAQNRRRQCLPLCE